MSYLDHLRGMQTQFDQARDQAQQNINAVNQNAYVRAEAKKNDYLAQIARHYEDIENKINTGAAVAGGVGALVKHGKRLRATILKNRAKAAARKAEPDLEKPETLQDTPTEPTDGPQDRGTPSDDARSGDIATPRDGEAQDPGIPEDGQAPRAAEGEDEGTQAEGGTQTEPGELADAAGPTDAGVPDPAALQDRYDALPRDLQRNVDEQMTDFGEAGGIEASPKNLKLADEVLTDQERFHRTGQLPQKEEGTQTEPEPDMPRGGGELGVDAPGANLRGPNLEAHTASDLERADPEGNIARTTGSELAETGEQGAKQIAQKVGSKIGGSVLGDVLGDVGMTILDSIPIIGDLAMAGQLIGGAIIGAKGTAKEEQAEKTEDAKITAPAVTTGIATQGIDIKSLQ